MLRRLKTFGAKVNVRSPELKAEKSSPKQIETVHDIFSLDSNVHAENVSFQTEHRGRRQSNRKALNLEEFEKEIDISERAKNFNFKFDDEDDNTINSSTTSHQKMDFIDSEAHLNVKDHNFLDTRTTETNLNPLKDKKEQETSNDKTEEEKKEEDRMEKAQKGLLGVTQKHGKNATLEDVEMSTDRDFDESNDGIDAKYRDDAHYRQIKWLIFPDDSIRYLWDIVIAINLGYTALIVPYNVSFIENPSTTLQILDYISDIIWAIDIVITFFCAYEDKDDNLITSRKKIFLNYITGWFFLDLVSILPFEYFLNINKSFNSLLRIAKLPKLARFLRLAKIARMLRFIKDGNKMARHIRNWLKFRPGLDRFFMTIAFFFIFCHLACCVWFLQANLNSDDSSNWVMRENLNDKDNFAHYVSSFYFIIATVVTVGYGDIHAGNTLERIVAVLLMFLGAFFYSFIIGSLSSVILNLDSRHRDLEKKLNTLIEIRQKYALDNIMFNKIKRALKYGNSRNEEDNIHFLNDLPLPLRTKLSVIMHKDILKTIIFFKPKSDRFLATIGPLLKPMKVGANEYIFTEGEYANEMYFIKSGTVQMVIKEYNNFPFMYIEQGYYFGEVDLLFGETRKHSYQAKTECELLSVGKKHFSKVFFQDFPDVGAEIYNNALKRRVRAQKIYKEALAQCQAESKEKNKKRKTFMPQISHITKAKLAGEVEKSAGEISNGSPIHDPNRGGQADSKELKEAASNAEISQHEEASVPKIEQKEGMPIRPSNIKSTFADINPDAISSRNSRIDTKMKATIPKMDQDDGDGAESKVEVDDQTLPPIKKNGLGKWSFLKTSFETKARSFAQDKVLSINSLLHPESTTKLPTPSSKEQLGILQQRVDQLEKSIEKILELYQSVLPREDSGNE